MPPRRRPSDNDADRGRPYPARRPTERIASAPVPNTPLQAGAVGAANRPRTASAGAAYQLTPEELEFFRMLSETPPVISPRVSTSATPRYEINWAAPIYRHPNISVLHQILDTEEMYRNVFSNDYSGVYRELSALSVGIWSQEARYQPFQGQALTSFFSSSLDESLPFLNERPYLLDALLQTEAFSSVFMHNFFIKPSYSEQYPNALRSILALPDSAWGIEVKVGENQMTPLMGILLRHDAFEQLLNNRDLILRIITLDENIWTKRKSVFLGNTIFCLARLIDNPHAVKALTMYPELLDKILSFFAGPWMLPDYFTINPDTRGEMAVIRYLSLRADLVDVFLKHPKFIHLLCRLPESFWVAKFSFFQKDYSLFYAVLTRILLSDIDEQNHFNRLIEKIIIFSDESWTAPANGNTSSFDFSVANKNVDRLLDLYPALLDKFLRFPIEPWKNHIRRAFFADGSKIIVTEDYSLVIFKKAASIPFGDLLEILSKERPFSNFHLRTIHGIEFAFFTHYSFLMGILGDPLRFRQLPADSSILNLIWNAGPEAWGLPASSVLAAEETEAGNSRNMPAKFSNKNKSDFYQTKEHLLLTATPLHIVSNPTHITSLENPQVLAILAKLPANTWGKIARKGIYSGTSPMYWICSHERGLSLLNTNPDLLDRLTEMSNASWLARKDAVASVSVGASCLFWLCRYKAGQDLLRNNATLWAKVKSLPLEVWNSTTEEGHGNLGTNPLYWLCKDAPDLLLRSPDLLAQLQNKEDFPEETWQVSSRHGFFAKKTAKTFLDEYIKKMGTPAPQADSEKMNVDRPA